MARIFISGSRVIPYFPEEAARRVDSIIDRGHDIVIGDSNRGVDATALAYLAQCRYEAVTVYTTHDVPRVKTLLPDWEIVTVQSDIAESLGADGEVRNRRDIETSKDREMGKVADFGLVIWQDVYTNRFGNPSVSQGSLRNMYQLLSEDKPVILYNYNAATNDFTLYELKSLADINNLIATRPIRVQKKYANIKKLETRLFEIL